MMIVQGALDGITAAIEKTDAKEHLIELLHTLAKLLLNSENHQQRFREMNGYAIIRTTINRITIAGSETKIVLAGSDELNF